jgi:capsular exopolysaccharide synthesis family protein
LDQATGIATSGNQQPITPTEVLTDLQLVTSAPVKAAVALKLGGSPSVSVAEVGQSNVISVTANAPSPARAALIANTYARAFVSYSQSVTAANLTAAEAQLNLQIASLNTQAKALGSSPAVAAEVTVLLSQEATLKEQLTQLQVAGVTSGGVEVVAPATAPSAPSSPQPARDALIGFFLGLIVGIGLAFAVEQLDDTVYVKDEVERLVSGARVLALVPSVKSWRRKKRALVVTMAEPNSMAGEAYRALRTSLQFAALETKAQVILVTSPSEAEGKSTTVANLGVVLAKAGERVAIVSGDLRRPRLGQFFGLDERAGLTSVLRGQCHLEAVIQAVPNVDRLSFLAAGARQTDPTAVLSGDRLAGEFDQLRQMFDVILVDSPPLLLFTDAVILAQAADTTLLVVAAGDTKGKDLRRATEELSLVQATVIGAVLNRVAASAGYRHNENKYGRSKRYEHSKRNGHGEYTSPLAASNGNYRPVAATNGNDRPVAATNGNGRGQVTVPAVPPQDVPVPPIPVPAMVPTLFVPTVPTVPNQSPTG